MKSLLLAGCFLFSAICTMAQDQIIKNSGYIISAKVKAVNTNTVVYKLYDNLNGPNYTILKKDVNKIKYENGTLDSFGLYQAAIIAKDKKKKSIRYGANLLSIIPGAFIKSIDGTMNDLAIGISYERALGKSKRLAFNMPVMLSFSNGKNYTNNIYVNNRLNLDPSIYKTYNTLFLMPGLKYYTSDQQSKIRYALGASLFVGLGSEPYDVYNTTMASYNTGEPVKDWNFYMYGLMFSNSLNISATKHLFWGLDMNLCMPLVENRRMQNSIADIIFGPFIQLGVKVGFRF
jgi:hypothetical protein